MRPPRGVMTADPDERATALALADLLEYWAETVPVWGPASTDPWYVFAERRYEAEKALMERLRPLPTCSIRGDEASTSVSLTLAGLQVRSQAGVAEACRAWAAKIRQDQSRGQAAPKSSKAERADSRSP